MNDDLRREADRLRRAAQTQRGQEIGALPAIADPARRRKALDDFAYFCRVYFPAAFALPFAPFHLRAAERIQTATTAGGMFAFAMPRGSGKTTLCNAAAVWALLSGRSKYVALIGASERAAERHLANLKTVLATNDLLAEDFPGECIPIRKLGRSARRAEGQKYNGAHTAIVWTAKKLALATIPEPFALGSGAVVEVFGLTGEIRGLNHTRQDGSIVRPSLAICDDPQTRESAKSPSQSAERERIIAGDIAYLAGPGSPIAVIMPGTIIFPGDLADRLLDREAHPEWQGERTRMVEAFPANQKLWDEYADILHNCQRDRGDISAATEFYRDHRKAMDAGAVVSWPERFGPGELSAIQSAMNLKIRNSEAFAAECQNEPLAEVNDVEVQTPDEIAAKVNGYKRLEFSQSCDTLTAFVDVQQRLLYYSIAAWQPDFTGQIIDYGAWPQQGRRYFTYADARKTLRHHYKLADDNAAIFRGLQELIAALCGREYTRDDGSLLRMRRVLVDCAWNSQLVNEACRQSPFAPILTPFRGRGVKASQAPISQWQQSKGKRCGPEWVPLQPAKQLVGVMADVNFWKRKFFDGLALPIGSAGAITLYKAPPEEHRMIADHLSSEKPARVEANGRVAWEWALTPGRDNHLLDCCSGAKIAASLCGVAERYTAAPGAGTQTPPRPRPSRKRHTLIVK